MARDFESGLASDTLCSKPEQGTISLKCNNIVFSSSRRVRVGLELATSGDFEHTHVWALIKE